jgi:hypothetical protein
LLDQLSRLMTSLAPHSLSADSVLSALLVLLSTISEMVRQPERPAPNSLLQKGIVLINVHYLHVLKKDG